MAGGVLTRGCRPRTAWFWHRNTAKGFNPLRARSSVRFCAFGAVASLLWLCTGIQSVHAQGVTGWNGTIRDSAGVTLVENLGEPLWTDDDRWSLGEVWKIGIADGDPAYMFGEISTLAFLSDGTVVVADRLGHHLKFFSPDGVHIRTVGTAGSGPGEFGSDILVYAAAGDTLLVADVKNMQVHSLAPDGTWLDSWRSFPDGGWIIQKWGSSPTGRLVTLMQPFGMPGAPPASDSLDLVLVRDVRGQVLDTLGRVPSRQTRAAPGKPRVSRYWTGRTDFCSSADGGLVAGRTDDYRLRWYTADGDLDRIVSLRHQAVPISDRDQSLLIQKREAALIEAGQSPSQVAQSASAVEFERFYPAWRSIKCSPDGTLWVQRPRPVEKLSEAQLDAYVTIGLPPASSQWDVFDEAGRYLGFIDIPPGVVNFGLTEDRLYGVWEDDLDVQHLTAWKIERGPSPRE